MSPRTRITWAIALLVALPLAVACGAAEEPAADNAANEPAEEAPAPEPEPAPVPEEPADSRPQEPELVGEIHMANENFDWGETTNESAAYIWTVTVTNDTTATLDITVRFEFLDENDAVVKAESATVRLDPAASRSIRERGSMPFDQANRVYSFRAVPDYEIVES